MRPFPGVLTLHRRRTVSTAVCIAALLVSSAQSPVRESPPSVIATRAFMITDPEVLAPFTFDRVIAALSWAQSPEWLETMTTTPTDQRQVLNPLAGFTAMAESAWRLSATQEWSHVRPIAIVNRFDLAPADYSYCGEYRLIFSRWTARQSRLNIAIEVTLPNPDPRRRQTGCARVAAFWWELAHIESDHDRRDRLESFFFKGLPPFPPVLAHKTFEADGEIRTSEINNGRPTFAQFELRSNCAVAQPCMARLTRVPLDNMPDAALFDANLAGERAKLFRREFVRQVASLSIPDVNRYSMKVDRTYSVSDVDTIVPAFNYQLPFRRAHRTRAGQEFAQDIADELRRIGSSLTPLDIISRAETQNCVGCHGKPGPVGGTLVFPKAFEQGEHIAAESLVGSVRLSPALREVFLPYRIDVLRNYLQVVAPTQGNMPERETVKRETGDDR